MRMIRRVSGAAKKRVSVFVDALTHEGHWWASTASAARAGCRRTGSVRASRDERGREIGVSRDCLCSGSLAAVCRGHGSGAMRVSERALHKGECKQPAAGTAFPDIAAL